MPMDNFNTPESGETVLPTVSKTVDREMILATFVADSFSLGSHWIYDRGQIVKHFPDGVSGLEAPRSSYHGDKGAGDLTHHGDQALVLLESLANRKSWSQKNWLEDWKAYWTSDPNSYKDGATSDTLANHENGIYKPSNSHDFSAVSRLGPLLAFLSDTTLDQQIESARCYVEATHGDPLVSDSAEWVVRALYLLKKGVDLRDAFEAAVEQGTYSTDFGIGYRKGVRSLKKSSDESISGLGQSCNIHNALPLTVWMALTHEDDPVEMLTQNALAGGDNAARGMVLGLFIAAQGKFAQLPETWAQDLNALPCINQALEALGK